MIDTAPRSAIPAEGPLPPACSYTDWRETVVGRGVLPVIAVTGSRGKTSVVRLLDAMLRAAGISTATRTNIAVSVRGKRQRGEIAPWTAALEELARGTLDVAIEELDWHTIHAMRLEPASYPLMAVTNVCGNKDACLIQGEARIAMASLPIVFDAVDARGRVIVNGDDFEVSGDDVKHDRATTRVCLSRESPGLRAALAAGEPAAWLEGGDLVALLQGEQVTIARADELRFALGGRAGFQVHNALIAAAIALELGVPADTIRAALIGYEERDLTQSEGFRVLDIDGVTVVIDRPNPSWFLRSVLRALRGVGPGRVVTVVGRLRTVPEVDLPEVGRLLGRISSHLVLHSEEDAPETAAAVRRGAAMNEVPPMIVHTTTEGRALARAMGLAKRGDVVLVLADRPVPLSRALVQSARRAAAVPLAG